MKENSLVPMEKQTSNVERFIQQAIDKDLSLDKMQALLAMRESFLKEQAKLAFDQAMSNFQGECPIISKDKEVRNSQAKGGGLRYKYAPLDQIVFQVRDLLKRHGFRYAVTSGVDEKDRVFATVKVMHIAGHTEESTFAVPIDKDAFMNEQQKVASAMTYAKRYAFCNALGILTGDEDNDGNTEEQKTPPTEKKQEEKDAKNIACEISGDIAIGEVTSILQRPTSTGGNKYTVVMGNERFGTFEKAFAEIAKTAQEKQDKIRIKFKKDNYGKEILTLTSGSLAS